MRKKIISFFLTIPYLTSMHSPNKVKIVFENKQIFTEVSHKLIYDNESSHMVNSHINRTSVFFQFLMLWYLKVKECWVFRGETIDTCCLLQLGGLLTVHSMWNNAICFSYIHPNYILTSFQYCFSLDFKYTQKICMKII